MGKPGYRSSPMVKDIAAGEPGSTIEILEVVNGILYFTVKESVFRRLWKTDSTNGTTQVLNENGNDISIRGSVLYKDQLIFNAGRLWAANGDTIKLITPGIATEKSAIVNDMLYFVGTESGSGNGLWKTDRTEGTALVKEITSATLQGIDHL